MPWQSLSLIGSLWALFLGGPRVLSADKAMSKLLMNTPSGHVGMKSMTEKLHRHEVGAQPDQEGTLFRARDAIIHPMTWVSVHCKGCQGGKGKAGWRNRRTGRSSLNLMLRHMSDDPI